MLGAAGWEQCMSTLEPAVVQRLARYGVWRRWETRATVSRYTTTIGVEHQKRREGHEIGQSRWSVRCPACSTLCGFLYDDAIDWLILPARVGWLVGWCCILSSGYTGLLKSVARLSRAVRIELRREEVCFCRVEKGGAGARLVGYRRTLRSVESKFVLAGSSGRCWGFAVALHWQPQQQHWKSFCSLYSMCERERV